MIGVSRSPEKSSVFLAYRTRKPANFRFYQLDLNRHTGELVELLDSFTPGYIVNFAAQSEVAPSWEYPEQWFETNVVALARLMKALKERDYIQRYVHISSPEVYGTCHGKVTETAPLNPTTPYAASKAAADLFLFTLTKNFGFPLVVIRATNVYGAHQQLWKIIPRSVIYLKTGKTIALHGGGAAVKSFIHIRDVSRGELMAMERGSIGQVYHLSPDNAGYAIRDVVEMVCNLTGRDFAASVAMTQERLGQDAAYVIDSSRARAEFGWRPVISLDGGLREVVGWVEDNWSVIRREPLEYAHRA